MDELGPTVTAILEAQRAGRTGARADAAATAQAMRANGYAPHDAALAFEERFGGLEVYERDPAPSLVIGAYACMRSGFTRWPDGGAANRTHELVPVILAWDDLVYFVSRDGRGWVQWPNDAAARAIADTGAQLVAQAVLWRALARSGFTMHDGHDGVARAAARGLEPIAHANSSVERWWGRPATLVCETITDERGAITIASE